VRLASRTSNSAFIKTLTTQPKLVEQVRDAILEEIASGAIAPGDRIIQEQIAQALGVSRQPVQQALVLPRNQGVLRDAPGRGLLVAPLDPDHVRHMYDIRAAIEGLAARRAAELGAERAAKAGPALIEAGRKAVAAGSVAKMIAADMRFHEFIYGLSGNPLNSSAPETHLTYTQRVMGEVLISDEKPRDVWDQHEAILKAVSKGDGDRAEALVRSHLMQAAGFMVARLRGRKLEPAS
jgi:DNA-binding GntR family transcriptional regulator